VGKLIALAVTHHRPLADYDDAVDGGRFIGPNVPPIVTIPTTAGTGSEVGRSGVVTLAATGRKTVIFSPYLLAKVALLDPELTRSMPARVTAATGFDALTHCLEAFCALGDHPMADAIAIGGLELCAAHLARAVEHGDDLAARGGMMKAAMMGAVAFQKGLGACHSLAHPLSSEKGMHHGLANALCLPAVIELNESVVATKLDRVRRIFDEQARTCARPFARSGRGSDCRMVWAKRGCRRPTCRRSPPKRSRMHAIGAIRRRRRSRTWRSCIGRRSGREGPKGGWRPRRAGESTSPAPPNRGANRRSTSNRGRDRQISGTAPSRPWIRYSVRPPT